MIKYFLSLVTDQKGNAGTHLDVSVLDFYQLFPKWNYNFFHLSLMGIRLNFWRILSTHLYLSNQQVGDHLLHSLAGKTQKQSNYFHLLAGGGYIKLQEKGTHYLE